MNITPPSTGFKVLSPFEAAEYALTIEGAELRATGPAAPTEELRALVERNREALKAEPSCSPTLPAGWRSSSTSAGAVTKFQRKQQ